MNPIPQGQTINSGADQIQSSAKRLVVSRGSPKMARLVHFIMTIFRFIGAKLGKKSAQAPQQQVVPSALKGKSKADGQRIKNKRELKAKKGELANLERLKAEYDELKACETQINQKLVLNRVVLNSLGEQSKGLWWVIQEVQDFLRTGPSRDELAMQRQALLKELAQNQEKIGEYEIGFINSQIQKKQCEIAALEAKIPSLEVAPLVAPEVVASVSPREKMLDDLSEKVCPEISLIFGSLLNHKIEDSVVSWSLSTDGSYTLTLKEPIKVWVPKVDGEETEHGALLVLGPVIEGRLDKTTKTIHFSKGFTMECAVSMPLVGMQKVTPNAVSICYKDEDHVEVKGGMYGQYQTKTKTLAKILETWGNRENMRSASFSYTRANRGIEQTTSAR